MYNRNYGGFDYVRIHSELLKSVPRLKFFAKFVRNCGYTRPLCGIEIAQVRLSRLRNKDRVTRKSITE